MHMRCNLGARKTFSSTQVAHRLFGVSYKAPKPHPVYPNACHILLEMRANWVGHLTRSYNTQNVHVFIIHLLTNTNATMGIIVMNTTLGKTSIV